MYKRINNIILILSLVLITSNYAYARSSSSSGGGRSSYSSSSVSSSKTATTTSIKSSYSTPSSKSTPATPSVTTTKSTYSTSTTTTPTSPASAVSAPPKTVYQSIMSKSDNSKKSAAAYNSYKAEQNKFTMKNTPSKGWSSYKSSPTSQSIYRSTPRLSSTVYTQRRTNFYTTRNYNMPSYGYSSYSSFGVFDSLALWFMLDHINDSQYRNMYYNQQNNPDMIKWRKEADRLAKDNSGLKEKLDVMDKEVDQLKGTPRDEKYIPTELGSIALTPDEGFSWGTFFLWFSIFTVIGITAIVLIKRVRELNARRLRTNNW